MKNTGSDGTCAAPGKLVQGEGLESLMMTAAGVIATARAMAASSPSTALEEDMVADVAKTANRKDCCSDQGMFVGMCPSVDVMGQRLSAICFVEGRGPSAASLFVGDTVPILGRTGDVDTIP